LYIRANFLGTFSHEPFRREMAVVLRPPTIAKKLL
jgi:hypothetical protein